MSTVLDPVAQPTKPKTAITLPSDQNTSGRTLGSEEIAFLTEAVQSGTLTSTKGRFTKEFETSFAASIGAKHGYACSSGSSALHVAFSCLDIEPGDEVITTSITDMGGLTPILFQGGVPVFADVDPRTYNVTAETIKARLSDRTKGIVVTHLFGNPCEMDEIMELARSRNIPVFEDCAQAFLATYKGQQIGTIGDIGCFSLQQGKHITTGEGGIVVTNNEEFARHMFLFINKAWGYGDERPDHYFSALNYRMCELQGAVALAQLQKLENVVQLRRQTADALTERLRDVKGVYTPAVAHHSECSWWKYCLHIDTEKYPDGAPRMGQLLREVGIFSAPRYIQKPAYKCEVFREQKTLGKSRFPFNLASESATDYRDELFPGSLEALAGVLVLPWNEKYTDDHVDFIANSVRWAASQL
ncbi:MAG: DegT/DnrJ/EryC1/StrS family aminotransferase [Verrucomicrobiota bacterium]